MRRRVAPSLPYNWRPSDAGEGGTRGRDARASSCEERAKPSADLSPNVIQVSGYARSIYQLIRWMIAIREDIAMAFFKREVGPVERFESALKDKQAARQKLADRLGIAETVLAEKRVAAERLAVAGATNAQLDRAEANMRAVEDRARTLRAALAEFDEQVISTERALADAKAQHDRELVADEIEAMAAAIEQAAPGFNAGAAALVEAVPKSAASMPEATRFATSVDAVRREVLSAADLLCWELWTSAVRTRAGNANIVFRAPLEPEQPPPPEIDQQLI